VCFDITSRSSFQSVEKWIEDAKNLRDDDVLLVLAGNKCDIAEKRQVTEQEAETFALAKNLMYFEVSAREGVNITEMFNEVAKNLTGIDTNPIKKSEIKNTGFSLDQVSAQAAQSASEQVH
jgi:GTPase SAR1 family protein